MFEAFRWSFRKTIHPMKIVPTMVTRVVRMSNIRYSIVPTQQNVNGGTTHPLKKEYEILECSQDKQNRARVYLFSERVI